MLKVVLELANDLRAVAFQMALVRAFTTLDTCVIPLSTVVMSSTFRRILKVLKAKVD